MYNSPQRLQNAKTAELEAPVEYDDGGSGILEACRSRFGSAGCSISCDASHTVWVKRPDGTKSVGLPQWMASRYSMEKLLADVEVKLDLHTVAH
ncbi:hypothetical protein [Anaerosoma tenue]|uniref:hypothetical protein n=1 Tax=Anaerosoma tenue TaxID=2933588 RepID=UPI002260FC41|nr:hypothetical protein [Anaerosoma tenue]MCK8115762.1 hypothetical protein [Anaerosoma tenue]